MTLASISLEVSGYYRCDTGVSWHPRTQSALHLQILPLIEWPDQLRIVRILWPFITTLYTPLKKPLVYKYIKQFSNSLFITNQRAKNSIQKDISLWCFLQYVRLGNLGAIMDERMKIWSI